MIVFSPEMQKTGLTQTQARNDRVFA
jgi:hypothetical protein